MLDAIYFKFLAIVGLTFIFMQIKFQANRPSHFWDMIFLFLQVKKQKRALNISKAIEC